MTKKKIFLVQKNALRYDTMPPTHFTYIVVMQSAHRLLFQYNLLFHNAAAAAIAITLK